MLKMSLALFFLIPVCGCVASTPKIDQGTAQGTTKERTLGPIRVALSNYDDCLKQNVGPYLRTKSKPKDIADEVAGKCEPRLSGYRIAVRAFFAAGLDPKMNGYSKILESKPEAHANKMREKGKRTTISRVLDARKLASD